MFDNNNKRKLIMSLTSDQQRQLQDWKETHKHDADAQKLLATISGFCTALRQARA